MGDSRVQNLVDREVKDRNIDKLKKQINELKLFKENSLNIDNVDYSREPDASNQTFLSIMSVAENWAIETQQKPSEILRQLSFAALQWIQTKEKQQKAYRMSGDTKFLEVSYVSSTQPEFEATLKNIGLLNKNLTEKEMVCLKSIDIFAEQFKDWIKRNDFELPGFWFKDAGSKVLQSDNVFVKKSDVLEFEAQINNEKTTFKKAMSPLSVEFLNT